MELENAVAAFGALSQTTRLEIFRLLIRQGPSGCPAGTIGDALSVSPSTLSFHLKELEQAGLAASRRDGRRIFYTANYAGIRELISFLMSDCCQGDPRLCGPYILKESRDEAPASAP